MKQITNLPDPNATIYTPHPYIQDFFNLLEPNFPAWLYEYINTKEMLRQHYISTTCGTIYSDLFESGFFYSNLDHSVGVALIVWHFTHDKKRKVPKILRRESSKTRPKSPLCLHVTKSKFLK